MNKEQDEISSTYCQAATIPRNASSEYEGSVTSPQLHPADATHPQHEARHHGIRCKSGGRWSSILSRVSRSAASLLNQHSPNLNELLQQQVGNEVVVFEPPEKLGSNGEVFELREEVERLKRQVAVLQGQLKLQGGAANSRQSTTQQWNNVDGANNENGATQNDIQTTLQQSNLDAVTTVQVPPQINNLQSHQISRYSRQLLLSDGFGVSGQIKLLSSRILVIGAGGIGSSLLLYLAAAGIGHVTIVDYDAVERSNLHRQIIHRDADAGRVNDEIQGKNKAQSAKEAMMALNPTVSIDALYVILDSTNIMELVSAHDLVVDASDNPATRYLINDACILCNKTLISGSAMGTEGQLTVYNYRPHDSDYKSACYRCLYPNPNPAEGCKSCSDNGVLGPVPGLIGVLQAVEVIKVLTGIGKVMHDRLLMYDSLPCTFINLKKPPPKQNCAICSSQATIQSVRDSELSLQHTRGPAVVCAMPNQSHKLPAEQRISCQEYNTTIRNANKPHVLLDVRVTGQYEMCSLDGSINIPLDQLKSQLGRIDELSNGCVPIYCVCRRGIASVEATRILQQYKEDGSSSRIHSVYNIDGGLNEWVKRVDSDFPYY